MTQTGTKSINFMDASVKDALRFRWIELSGRKSTSLPIAFPQPFDSTPVVTVGLTGLYTMQESISFGAEAENITPNGFDLVLTVTSVNAITMLKFQWLATDA